MYLFYLFFIYLFIYFFIFFSLKCHYKIHEIQEIENQNTLISYFMAIVHCQSIHLILVQHPGLINSSGLSDFVRKPPLFPHFVSIFMCAFINFHYLSRLNRYVDALRNTLYCLHTNR